MEFYGMLIIILLYVYNTHTELHKIYTCTYKLQNICFLAIVNIVIFKSDLRLRTIYCAIRLTRFLNEVLIQVTLMQCILLINAPIFVS